MDARQPGDPVPPCPTPARDPDGRPYGSAYLDKLAARASAREGVTRGES